MIKRIVIPGGSGFLGQALIDHWAARDYEIVVLTRSSTATNSQARFIQWDGKTLGDWSAWLEGAEAIINLTGKSVNCRYTPKNRNEIIASRVNSVNAIGQAIQRCTQPPNVWIQASSLAIYGDAGDRICDESAPYGQGFPVETCIVWEQALAALSLAHIRTVALRIGFALNRSGGAFGPLKNLAKFFMGGTAGSGKQYVSWIHINDLNRMFDWCLERDDLSGVFNATSPRPMTNAEFMRAIRHVLHRPWSPPIPSWAVQFGSIILRTEAELVLRGRRCIPKRFSDLDFKFEFPELIPALQNLTA
ncbi:MAG TPA: TIGR01777 family oxidoreductase [Anaerolineae bacterium]|nr:TIGR01777 family oxidoreductase [Anaerolineae bacterium]